MTDPFEELCAWVHEMWMEASRAHGRCTAESRHNGTELMRPYAELEEIDREDDRRVVRVVLNGLAKLPARARERLIADAPDDLRLLALIREAAEIGGKP